MRGRIHDILTLLACLVWVASGLALLLVLLPGASEPDVADWLLAAGCAALGLAFSSVGREFRSGGQRLVQSPDAGFLVLAAVLLEAPVAALVGAVAVLWSIRRAGTRLERAFLATGGALATGCASVVAHALVDGRPSGREVLVAVAAAAVVRSAALLVGQLLVAETRARGGALAVLRGTPVPVILALDAGLPIAAVSVAGPFFGDPALALLVVLGGQLLAWAVLVVQHDQHRGRRVADDLLATFTSYVPRHVAERVLARAGEHDDPALVGERRDVTVMFVDVRGFSAWSERTDPAEVLAELNRLLGDLADAILAADGTVDKFTGDGLMAIWNAPADQPDHAALALSALPRLLMRVREFNIRREAQRSEALEVGIGIATGPAVVGTVGHRERLAYTAIGDTVNLAARLESATRTLGVAAVLDEGTFLALPPSAQRQLTRLDSIEVKGRVERVRPYAPTALLRHAGRSGAA
ncbi:MAG: cyaA 4 [Thermoleophilia bacterium]|nr:cyaA 4 [Thermoleophilia bacterium]